MDDEQQVSVNESVDNTSDTSSTDVPFEQLSAAEMRAALLAREEQPAEAESEEPATAGAAETPAEDAPSASAQAEPPQQQAPVEDWERKAKSYAGNNQQLQQQNRALLQQQQQLQQQYQAMQQQMEDFQAIQQLRSQVPAEFADQVEADYRQRKGAERQAQQRDQQSEQYRQYLQSEWDQITQARQEIARQTLPQHMPDFANFIAETTEAPVEPLHAVLQTKAFQGVYQYVHSQNDLDLVGQVLAAVGEHLKGADDGRKAANREAASASGRHRAETGTGVAGGPSLQQKISGLRGAAWDAYAQKVRETGVLQ